MRRQLFCIVPVVIALIAGLTLGVKYLAGSWAPTQFEGGLNLSQPLELLDSQGLKQSGEVVSGFIEICGRLRTTTRDIGVDRGEGFVRLRYPATGDADFLTIYPAMGVIFHGRWIDARTYSMMGRRAPCFEISGELSRFIETHKLRNL